MMAEYVDLCKQRFSTLAWGASAPQATTSGTASARLAEFPTIEDAAKEGKQGTGKQPAPSVVQENGDKELEPAEASPKPAAGADNSLQAPSEAEVQKGGEKGLELETLAETLPSTSEEATQSAASSPSCSQPHEAALPTLPIVKGEATKRGAANLRKRGGSRAREAAAAEYSSPGPASSSSEGDSPEYKRHAVTADVGAIPRPPS
ncbi:hypothetical protein MTO96_004627 [Rhipicephalus appendiculatus]